MLDRLRQQPEHTRIAIAVGAALTITLAIAAFWVWSFTGRFADAREDTPETARPFAVIGDLFRGARDDIGGLRDKDKDTTTVTDASDDSTAGTPADTRLLEESFVGSDGSGELERMYFEPEPAPEPEIAEEEPSAPPQNTTQSEDTTYEPAFNQTNTASNTETSTTSDTTYSSPGSSSGPPTAPLPGEERPSSSNDTSDSQSTSSSSGPPVAPLPSE